MGANTGCDVGMGVDLVVGASVGDLVGTKVIGLADGASVGDLVGSLVVGYVTGANVGFIDGTPVGGAGNNNMSHCKVSK